MLCVRCGLEDPTGYIAKRVERGTAQLCNSCTAKPVKFLNTKYGRCQPWQGEFDENDNPLDDFGHYFLPGQRLCGYRDCVEPDHVVAPSEPELRLRFFGKARIIELITAAQEWTKQRNGKS